MDPANYFQSFLLNYLDGDPELLTAFGLSRHGHPRTGGMLSESTDRFVLEPYRESPILFLRLSSGFDETQMSEDDAVSKRILCYYLRSIVEAEPHYQQSYPVHSRGGLSDLLLSGVSPAATVAPDPRAPDVQQAGCIRLHLATARSAAQVRAVASRSCANGTSKDSGRRLLSSAARSRR